MKQLLKISFLAALACFSTWLVWAQKIKDNTNFKGQVYLSDQATRGGKVSVHDFMKLIQDSLWVKDERDNSFQRVSNFSITYADRGLFDDEAGNPIITTDLYTSNCRGKVDSLFLIDTKYRAKPDDTVYIDNVRFLNAKLKELSSVPAKPIKIILTN